MQLIRHTRKALPRTDRIAREQIVFHIVNKLRTGRLLTDVFRRLSNVRYNAYKRTQFWDDEVLPKKFTRNSEALPFLLRGNQDGVDKGMLICSR